MVPILPPFTAVSILARPHWTGARHTCQFMPHPQIVSILARPHWTGAPLPCTPAWGQPMFQSSPVRMGRALCTDCCLRSCWAGFNPHPSVWDGRSSTALPTPWWLPSFNPHPSVWDGRSCQPLNGQRCDRVSILARPHWTGARETYHRQPHHRKVSILARPHWTGAQD